MKHRASRLSTEAVGICIPVHDEEHTLLGALTALDQAIRYADVESIDCRVAIVLDACSDRSESVVRRWKEGVPDIQAFEVTSTSRNVGIARQAGCLALLRSWIGLDPSRVWLATTDADSQVPPHWLVHQMECRNRNVDLWAGRVEVTDWSGRSPATSRTWNNAYLTESAPVHGANMGISADLFLKVGGFPPVESGEDNALRRAVARTSSIVYYDREAPVKTSARSRARAPLGFAHYLDSIEEPLLQGVSH